MNEAAREILAARSPLLARFMARTMRRYAARNFHAVRVARGTWPKIPESAPALVYCNHPSWWDPVTCVVLQTRAFPARLGFGPIAAAELRRYGILRHLGLFGIEEGPRGARRFLLVAEGLLSQPGTVLCITAEGAFRDVRDRPLALRPGVAHLMRRVPGLAAVPLALEYTFWQERTPEALARFGPPIFAEPARDAAEWTALLSEALTRTMDALAGDARARDAAAFETILAGQAGIGGIYDGWRRLRAAARGRRARLEHGSAP